MIIAVVCVKFVSEVMEKKGETERRKESVTGGGMSGGGW